MGKNKIITSQGNVQFITSKGRTTSVHPWHVYAVYEGDTVSFLFIYMKDYSGQAFFASQYEDLELNGVSYDNMEDLKNAINTAFAHAGAQARAEIVDELPEDPYTNTIYLVKKEHGEGYDEYIWNEEKSEWELIGDTDIEFERYLQIADFNVYSAATQNYIDAVSGETVANHNDIVALSGAVDTEVSARTDADTALSGAIDTVAADLVSESSARTAADTVLQNNINTANGRIDAEQLARAQADTAISGAVDTLKSSVSGLTNDKADKVDAVAYAEYVSSAKTINFKNISGTVISTIDATDFVKDGMIEDVRIENGYLIIDFNTESGIQDISIPLTDIFNPDNYYDKDAIDGIVSGLNESIDEKFDASGITAYSTSQEVTAEIEAATSGKAENSDLVALSGEVATLSGNAITSGDVQNQIDAAVSGKQDTLIAGENITISGNVISSSGGVDSGAVESIIEDYMTDDNVTISDVFKTKIKTYEYLENHFSLSLNTNDLGIYHNPYLAPSYLSGEGYLTGDGGTATDIFKNMFNISSNAYASTRLALLIKSDHYNNIADEYKNYTTNGIWFGLDDYIKTPTKMSDLVPGWVEGRFRNNAKTWSQVSGSSFALLDCYEFLGSQTYGFKNVTSQLYMPYITLSGYETNASQYKPYLGEYVIIWTFEEENTQDPMNPIVTTVITPVTNDGGNAVLENKQSTFTYDLNSSKTYTSTDISVAYNGALVANEALTTANQAKTMANNLTSRVTNIENKANSAYTMAEEANRNIVQVDWNQSSSGDSMMGLRYDYIKNRPFYLGSENNRIVTELDYNCGQINGKTVSVNSGTLSLGNTLEFWYFDCNNVQTKYLGTVTSGSSVTNKQYAAVFNNGTIYMDSDDLSSWTIHCSSELNYNRIYIYLMELKKLDSIFIDDDIARVTDIPTSNSGLTNDAGYITSASLPTITSAVTENSTAVVESGGVYRQMGGLKLEKITQSAYDALVQAGTVDADTLYIISD